MRAQGSWIAMALIPLMVHCGGGGGVEVDDVVEDVDMAAVQLSFEVEQEIHENQPFTLHVRAVAPGGEVVSSVEGAVTLSTSVGVLFPQELTMESGEASGELMLNREGNGLLNASVGDLSGAFPITVEVTDWVRDPVDSVLSGGLANDEHWNHGGIHSPSVVASEGVLDLYFSTREVKSEEGDFTGHVLGRARSLDGGVEWSLEPDAPIWTPEDAGVDGFGSLSVLVDDAGEHWLFHSAWPPEGLPGVRVARSPDGLDWESAPCLEVLSGFDAFWTQQGVMDPSVVDLGDGVFRMYFTVRRMEGTQEIRELGAVEGSCEAGWGEPQEILARGSQGSWDAGRVSAAHVWREQGLWRMLYVGAASDSGSAKSALGYASSEDGWTWVRAASNPVVQKEAGFWEVHGVGAATTALLSEGSRGLFYMGFPTDKRPRVIRAIPSSSPINSSD